jgi:hypothetical protein
VRIEPLEGRLLLHAGHEHPVASSSSSSLSALVDSPVVVAPTSAPIQAQAAAPGQPLLPDMVPLADEERGYVYGWEYDVAEMPGHVLLRLTTAVGNRGDGPMDLHGGAVNPDGTQQVYQQIQLQGGGSTSRLAGSFSYHPQHEHIHFDGFAAYRLRQVGPNNTVGAVAAEGDKISFCLLDIYQFDPDLPGSPIMGTHITCGQDQGISVGWADEYTKDLPDQWIDVTGVPDGRYWLEVVADPDNRLLESDETNNSILVPIDLLKPTPDPTVTSHVPVGQYPAPAGAVEFSFDQPMRQSSFGIADDVVSFSGPTGADLRSQLTGFTWLDDHTLRVSFKTQPALGLYSMTIGPNILAADNGAPMDQDRDKDPGEVLDDRYTATFNVDNRLGPDAFGYDARAVPLEDIDLSIGGPGVSVVVDNADEGANPLKLGRNTFNFYGVTYTGDAAVYASTNGLITFGAATTAFTNGQLDGYPPNPSVAVLWDDLRTDQNASDVVLSKLVDDNGDGAADRLVVEWSDVRRHSDPGPAPAVNQTFQAILTLNTGATPGAIVLNYRDIDTGSIYSNGSSATVGVKAGGTDQGGNRLLVSYNAGNNPLVATGRALRIAPAPPSVAGRHLFYNRSAFDGGSAAAGVLDDGAIAADKQAYRPAAAAGAGPRFANLSSYSRGINGVMVDVAGLFGRALALSDFEFRTGTGPDPAAWPLAPAPSMAVRRGAGAGGSDRFTFVWPDNAVRNTWLRVTVKSNGTTALAAPDVFYFGHLAGESGNRWPASGPAVNAVDQARTRAAIAASRGAVPITNPFDYNRDGRVNALDLAVSRAGERDALPQLSPAAALPATGGATELVRATPGRRSGLPFEQGPT